ncbi:MAG: sigma-70 family RNA polymerase sigma factor [Verrucomicrobia bacterium]|nr:sigma-70 family RNA polymerase sigma factor [Verrucomicrobiota bacterium]
MPTTLSNKSKTQSSLLARLKDWGDNDSWQTFFDTYWPLIYGTALKAGLTETEAEDVVQDTVITVAKKIKEFHYDRAKGSFRGWLGAIIRSRIVDRFRKRLPARQPRSRTASGGTRTSTIGRIPDPAAVDFFTVYDMAWREYVRETALGLLRQELSPKQYQLFDLYVNQERPVPEIIATLGVNRAQIYMARLRGLRVLKKATKRLEMQLESGAF